MKKFTVPCDTDLKKFTDENYPQGSFCLAALLRNKDIKVNGVRTGKNIALKAGDGVVYFTSAKQESLKSHFTVYRDENVLVADKPDGVETAALLKELEEGGEYYAVHRLDRNTRGLLIFAKNRAAESELLSAFKGRRVEKIYLAQCKDNFRKDEDRLSAYLKKDGGASRVEVTDREAEGSVKIVTEYRVLARRGDIADVEIVLHTGKTHQIRAHMAHIGCPVLGDEKYGDEELNKKYGCKRQKLIAYRLKFSFRDGVLQYLDGMEFVSGFDF